MDDKAISTAQLFRKFPDEKSARTYLEARLWKSGPKCPECSTTDRITVRKNGFYRCNACKLDFTIRTGTIFGRSHVPLHKWLYAMYLLALSRHPISSPQLSKQIRITQKSAWYMLQRLREATGTEDSMLGGSVERAPKEKASTAGAARSFVKKHPPPLTRRRTNNVPRYRRA